MRSFSALAALVWMLTASATSAQHLRSQHSLKIKFTRAISSHQDSSCWYSLFKLSCMPPDLCSYQYEFGDLTPSQSCRLKVPVDGTLPKQIHLAYAGRTPGTAMTISWTTFTKVSDPAVWIGASPSSLALSAAVVDVVTYYSDNKYSLFNYHATVTGLTPHTTYSFQVGSQASARSRTDVSSFTTARATSDADEFDIALYGDMGIDTSAQATVDYINKNLRGNVDFVFHIGDISYADNAGLVTPFEALGFFYEQTYNDFMNSLTPFMSQVPYMVLVGNHEAECHSAACVVSSSKRDQLGNYQAYNARFRMPSTESDGAKNMWYSFDHGPAHFTTISSETDYPGAPANTFFERKYGGFGNQMAWLEADLQKADANRANTPWIIVTMHRSIYTRTHAGADGQPTDEALPVQKAFEDLFLKYNVDIVVSGHLHLYERQLPIKHGQPVMDGVSSDKKTYTNPKAPVYLVTGAAGNNEGHGTYDTKTTPAWNAVVDATHWGISKLHVSRSSLHWQFVAVDTDTVFDDFVITK
jgi:acid phosphatase type 7